MDLAFKSSVHKLKWWFWILSLVTLGFIFWMKHYLAPLQSGEIIRYEMAKSPGLAAAMIDDWKQNGKFEIVVKSIHLDYIFILLYTLAISVACRFLSYLTSNEIFIKAGKFFSVFIFVAAIFDVIENMAMMNSLQSPSEGNVSLAYKMAISKFSIVLMSLFFIAACLVSWLLGRFSMKEKFWKS